MKKSETTTKILFDQLLAHTKEQGYDTIVTELPDFLAHLIFNMCSLANLEHTEEVSVGVGSLMKDTHNRILKLQKQKTHLQ